MLSLFNTSIMFTAERKKKHKIKHKFEEKGILSSG